MNIQNPTSAITIPNAVILLERAHNDIDPALPKET
jgi:hypothetical protein